MYNRDMKTTITLTPAQASLFEIYLEDPAHDDEREEWWPSRTSARVVEFDQADAHRVADLFTEISNSEEGNAQYWKPAHAMSCKAREAAK